MTDKIVLRNVDEFMAGYEPVYNPIYPLFMSGSTQYATEVGTQTLRRVQAVADIRLKNITPKDTELRQISVNEASKVFKKFFLSNQYVQSQFQDQQGVEDVITQVLDEHHKQADDTLIGDGINSGLYNSTDANYLLESSYEVQKATDASYLADLYGKIMVEKQKADLVSGRKLIMLYGTTLMPQYNGLFTSVARPFRSVLQEALPGYSIVDMPADITPSGANGFLIANMDQIKLHWTALPQLKAQGLNEEKSYYWFNFLMGSMMIDVKVANGIIRQPLTLEA